MPYISRSYKNYDILIYSEDESSPSFNFHFGSINSALLKDDTLKWHEKFARERRSLTNRFDD